jgi:hypothetical protein
MHIVMGHWHSRSAKQSAAGQNEGGGGLDTVLGEYNVNDGKKHLYGIHALAKSF